LIDFLVGISSGISVYPKLPIPCTIFNTGSLVVRSLQRLLNFDPPFLRQRRWIFAIQLIEPVLEIVQRLLQTVEEILADCSRDFSQGGF